MSTIGLDTIGFQIEAIKFFPQVPQLKDATKKTLALFFRETIPESFTATVTLPDTARSLPQTLDQLGKAETREEQEKIYKCLKIAGAVTLCVLGLLLAVVAPCISLPLLADMLIAAEAGTLGIMGKAVIVFGIPFLWVLGGGSFVKAVLIVDEINAQKKHLDTLEQKVSQQQRSIAAAFEDENLAEITPQNYGAHAQRLLDGLNARIEQLNDNTRQFPTAHKTAQRRWADESRFCQAARDDLQRVADFYSTFSQQSASA